MSLRHYNLRAVFLTLGPYRMGGYGADGGFTVQPAADFGERVKGADGEDTVVSYSNDDDAIVEVTLSERSKGYRDVMVLATAVRDAVRNGTPIPSFPVAIDDSINGDHMAAPEFAFLAFPGMDKAKTSGERTFKIVIPHGYRDARFGAAIV